jgi:hypothetical protein
VFAEAVRTQAIADFFREEGIDVRLDSKVVGVEKQGNSIAMKVESAGRSSQVVGTHLLVAVGRRPNTDDLGLGKAGVATDVHGYIQVDDQLRTNVAGIWALGDCNGRGAFTHTSWNDFEIVAANLLDNEERRVSDRIAMEDVSRAYEKGETKGFMKILVDRDSKQILGASLLGLSGDEVIHCILDVMYAKAPYTVLQRLALIWDHWRRASKTNAFTALGLAAGRNRGCRLNRFVLCDSNHAGGRLLDDVDDCGFDRGYGHLCDWSPFHCLRRPLFLGRRFRAHARALNLGFRFFRCRALCSPLARRLSACLAAFRVLLTHRNALLCFCHSYLLLDYAAGTASQHNGATLPYLETIRHSSRQSDGSGCR